VPDDLTIIFEPAEEGGYTAYIAEIPGAISEGETLEEARRMVLDAARELVAFRRDKALAERASSAIVEQASLSA
jgi:predicted RNase H-like HicB family nuclease